jgi:hypothetical protein
MKIFKILFLTILTISIVSCGDDDDAGNDVGGSADLVGTWNAVSVNYTGTTLTEANGLSIQADFVGEGMNIDYTLDFTSNPNELTSNGTYDIELTTTILDETTTQTFTNIEFASTGEWLLDGDQMTVTADGVTTVVTVVELTATSLILNIVDVQTQTTGEATITVTTDSTLIYNR